MKPEVTIISDDCRIEVGNKVSLLGIYDEAIIFRTLPARLLKLSFYQRWTELPDAEKVTISIRGSALADQEFRVEAKPSTPPKRQNKSRIVILFGPIVFMTEGTLEFHTFLNDESEPVHSHQLSIRTDPDLKLQ